MSGRGKTPSRSAPPAPTPTSSSSARRISDFFAPSSFSALQSTSPIDLPPPTNDLRIPSNDLQTPSTAPHNPSADPQIPPSDPRIPSNDLQIPSNDPQPPSSDPTSTNLAPAFTPVGGKRSKRKVLSPSNPATQPHVTVAVAPPPPPSPPLPSQTAIPIPPTFSGADRLASALQSHPNSLQKGFLVPKPGIFDPFLRMVPSYRYSVPKSPDELLVDVKTTINPLLREMQSIIADQDDLIKRLLALSTSARPTSMDRGVSTSRTITSDISSMTDEPTLATVATSPVPALETADSATSPLPEALLATPPLDAPPVPPRLRQNATRPPPVSAQPREPRLRTSGTRREFLSRREKAGVALRSAAPPDAIDLIFHNTSRRPLRDGPPLQFRPVFFRTTLRRATHSAPLHWLRFALHHLGAPYATDISPIGPGLRLFEG
ncbi:hypothetical protein DFJ73DRAFT_941669 [Zopfochytrium polystomum]|nr:hypothetical protein DFJ73DRAFT_941669 [Zopfochytrium polystomum]